MIRPEATHANRMIKAINKQTHQNRKELKRLSKRHSTIINLIE